MAGRPWYLALALLSAACATGKPNGEGGRREVEVERGPAPVLASSHCQAGVCVCREHGDKRENPPPPPGKKRIELRLASSLGSLSLDSPTVGHFEPTGEEETCYYVDLDINQTYTFRLTSKEAQEGSGVAPMLKISEYGPFGHYWYDIVKVGCGFGDRACDPDLAREWGQEWLDKRKRGRLDACGSLVVLGLKWSSSGGQAEANGWRLRDFFADFGLEVKKFATEFPPRSPQCQIGH